MNFKDISQHLAKYFGAIPTILFGVYACNSLTSDSIPPKNESVSTLVDERKNDLESRCNYDYDGWDKQEMEGLLKSLRTSRVTMFGIDHGDPNEPGDNRDGKFVAGLLSSYKSQGFNYVAIEGPSSLNKYLKKESFEKEAMRVFGPHWTEFGPVIQKARELRMRLVFYDVEKDHKGDYSEREVVAFGNLKREIFDRDPSAKLVVYSGAKHMHKEPVEVSFIKPGKVKTIGCFLQEMFGDKLTTVYLQPEKTRVAFFFDHSFYLGKQCVEEVKSAH